MYRLLKSGIAAATVLLAASACSDSAPSAPDAPSPVEMQTLAQSTPENTETLNQGSWGNYDLRDGQNIVISNEADFASFWATLFGSQDAPPQVDFSESSVVAALQGHKRSSGYHIEVRGITLNQNRAAVQVVATAPGSTCATQDVLTSPYHIVVVSARPDGFAFERQEQTDSCGS